MPSEKAYPTQSAILLALLCLTACGGTATTSTSTCSVAPAAAPASVPAPVVTSMGTDFYLTLPDHLCVSSPGSCPHTTVSNELAVGASTATTIDVTFNGTTTQFPVGPGTNKIVLDPAVVLTSNETIEDKAIHVTSVSPVSIHVVSESAYSADGYLALPTAGLGTRYYVMSYASAGQPGSEFAVVATQDNTSVDITPKAAAVINRANVAFRILLNKGQTFQFANPGTADLTGSLVVADKPVAVFSGHRFANVPSGTSWGDYLVEQLPDVTLWGKTHHTTPFSGRSRYTVRLMASQDNTTFTTIPADKAGLIGTLNAGEFAEIEMQGPGEFVSNNPVLVAQFMRGYADDTANKGDPSMVIVTPAEQAVSDSVFRVHGLAGTNSVSINIVTETAALANLTLDNVPVNASAFTAVDATSLYSTGTVQVIPGVHSLQGSATFSAIVYDYGIAGNAVSYAYPVAQTLTPPVAAAPAPVQAASTQAVCVNSQALVNASSNEEAEADDDSHEDHASGDRHEHHGNDGHEEHDSDA